MDIQCFLSLGTHVASLGRALPPLCNLYVFIKYGIPISFLEFYIFFLCLIFTFDLSSAWPGASALHSNLFSQAWMCIKECHFISVHYGLSVGRDKAI